MALLLTNQQTDRFASEFVLKTYQRLFPSPFPGFHYRQKRINEKKKVVILEDVSLL